MAIHPRRFAEQSVRNRNISILSADFCAAFTVFILYSILSSVVMYLTPSGSVSALAGVPINMEFPLWKIITVSFCGALFTMAGLASMLCVIIPFISKGRLSLRLPTLLILVPAVYFVFFLIPGVPAPVRASKPAPKPAPKAETPKKPAAKPAPSKPAAKPAPKVKAAPKTISCGLFTASLPYRLCS